MVGKTFALLALTALVEAHGGCPDIWSTIAKDLSGTFVGSNGCTDLARGAIRFAFHDAASYSSKTQTYEPATGGADGSLLLTSEEVNRSENGGLKPTWDYLTEKYNQYKDKVGAADFVQFAGSVGIVSCPGGPKVRTVVGRKDSNTAAPEGLLPAAFGPDSSHDVILQLFEDKGISAAELAALLGAHSSSKAFTQESNGIPVGGAQDSSPGQWDVKYYAETYKPPPNVYRFESDINLSRTNTTVGKEFKRFVNRPGQWNAAFAPAMAHLSLLGIPESDQQDFIDCTDALPSGSGPRLVRAAPINDRIR